MKNLSKVVISEKQQGKCLTSFKPLAVNYELLLYADDTRFLAVDESIAANVLGLINRRPNSCIGSNIFLVYSSMLITF